MKNIETAVVTQHESLIDYLKETGVITGDVTVIRGFAKPEDVSGKRVIGVLPIHLAALASEYVNVNVNITQEERANKVELTLDQIRERASDPVTYKVTVVEPQYSCGYCGYDVSDAGALCPGCGHDYSQNLRVD